MLPEYFEKLNFNTQCAVDPETINRKYVCVMASPIPICDVAVRTIPFVVTGYKLALSEMTNKLLRGRLGRAIR
jgi:hypothetical protein